MSASKTIEFDTREFFDWMDRLSGRADMLAGEALLKGAIEAESRAKELAPIDTGRLRSSIHWESRTGSSSGEKFTNPPQAGEIFVGSNLKYAGEQEYKHKNSSGFLRAGFNHGMQVVEQNLIKMNLDD